MVSSIYVKLFNTHLREFINDIIIIFEDNSEVNRIKDKIKNVSLISSSKIIRLWYKYSKKHKEEIRNKNLDYFLEREYIQEVEEYWIMAFIDSAKKNIGETSDTNKSKIIEYIFNLTKISFMYINEKEIKKLNK